MTECIGLAMRTDWLIVFGGVV